MTLKLPEVLGFWRWNGNTFCNFRRTKEQFQILWIWGWANSTFKSQQKWQILGLSAETLKRFFSIRNEFWASPNFEILQVTALKVLKVHGFSKLNDNTLCSLLRKEAHLQILGILSLSELILKKPTKVTTSLELSADTVEHFSTTKMQLYHFKV